MEEILRNRWISMEDERPRALQRVYLLFERPSVWGGEPDLIQTMGEYVPPLTVKAEDYYSPEFVDAEHAVYSPEDDEYYAPEGFYEYQFESDIAWHLSNPVKYWMPLLPLPTE